MVQVDTDSDIEDDTGSNATPAMSPTLGPRRSGTSARSGSGSDEDGDSNKSDHTGNALQLQRANTDHALLASAPEASDNHLRIMPSK